MLSVLARQLPVRWTVLGSVLFPVRPEVTVDDSAYFALRAPGPLMCMLRTYAVTLLVHSRLSVLVMLRLFPMSIV